MGSLRGLRLAAGSHFRFCERDAFSSLRLTRNSDLKRINGFCNKLQESPKPPTHTYGHRMPLHKPTDWEEILIWSGRFKKEDEIPETVSFEMLDAAKNKVWVKIGYVMIASTVAGCILMIIEGKKAAKRHESLTSLNLEKKARLRGEAAVKRPKQSSRDTSMLAGFGKSRNNVAVTGLIKMNVV